MRTKASTACAAAMVLALAACGPRIRPLQTVMDNGEVLREDSEELIEEARVQGELAREQIEEMEATATAAALSRCAPEVCAAISRGELVLGMEEAAVLAATRTTPHAWNTRSHAGVTLMTPRDEAAMPQDVIGKIAFVNLQDGRVASYTYAEPQGFRTVTEPADATLAGRNADRADALLRQGDDYAVAGQLDLALARYDQADILRPSHPETTLRIARTLDKQLRPIEAILRYQMFIHQMELEKIHARGDVAAKIAEAIARAHERIIVLERHHQ